MSHTWVATKIGMTQVFDADGMAVPVTVLKLLPLTVTQRKTKAKDGYDALQVGYGEAKAKHLTKGQQGHLQRHQLPLFRHLMEIRTGTRGIPPELHTSIEIGAILSVDGLTDGLTVDVTGHSIGKGFQGNTKRWHHGRGPMSHGSKSHRLPGSIGAGTTPGRVFKGLNMAGRMGNAQVTVKNLRVLRVLTEKQLVLIKGAVPGVEGGYLIIRPKRGRWNVVDAA